MEAGEASGSAEKSKSVKKDGGVRGHNNFHDEMKVSVFMDDI